MTYNICCRGRASRAPMLWLFTGAHRRLLTFRGTFTVCSGWRHRAEHVASGTRFLFILMSGATHFMKKRFRSKVLFEPSSESGNLPRTLRRCLHYGLEFFCRSFCLIYMCFYRSFANLAGSLEYLDASTPVLGSALLR